jgi:hypothetical protein
MVRPGPVLPGDTLGDVLRGQYGLDLLTHPGVVRADHGEQVGIGGELGRDVLADVGLGLVVLGVDLDLPARDRVCAALACRTASITEFWMPSPNAEISPVVGPTTPILTTLSAAAELPAAPLLRAPQAVRANVATSNDPPSCTTDRCSCSSWICVIQDDRTPRVMPRAFAD